MMKCVPDLQHLRLLKRIQRRYQTLEDGIDVGGNKMRFTRVADPNVVLDAVVQAEERREKSADDASQPLHLPYWAELWDSGIGICEYILAKPALVAGRTVLDLGCGMGLAGSVAASAGARVCFADYQADALLFARLNSLDYRERVRTYRLDWRGDRLNERFDIILGSDILYERSQWEYLEPFWREHLSPAGSILLGEPGRQTGDVFPDWIAARGWTIEFHSQKVPTRTVPIRLFELSRPRSA